MTEQEAIYYRIKEVQKTQGISITQAADRVLGERPVDPLKVAVPTPFRNPATTLRN